MNNLPNWECDDSNPNKTNFEILIDNKKTIAKTCDSHKSFLKSLSSIKIISEASIPQ